MDALELKKAQRKLRDLRGTVDELTATVLRHEEEGEDVQRLELTRLSASEIDSVLREDFGVASSRRDR